MKAVTTVIITGGGGHLGQAVTRWWTKYGVRLVLVDRDADRLARARSQITVNGIEPTLVTTDVADLNDLKAAVASLPDTLWEGPLSLVVAHALSGKGLAAKSARLGGLDRDQWQHVIDINLTSVVFSIEVFLPFMQRAGGGRIVLVSSTAGLSASPTAAFSYAVSKATVAALPRLLAPQLASSQVLINAVAPGKFDNPDWPDNLKEVQQYKRSVPLGRLASADEVAALIGFLSSSANTYMTGQTIVQDGGRLSALPLVD
jgi:3-oxoacyl-[acyl-carrier protein] reductase